MALQLSPGQQPVEHAAKLDQSIKINTYLCQPQMISDRENTKIRKKILSLTLAKIIPLFDECSFEELPGGNYNEFNANIGYLWCMIPEKMTNYILTACLWYDNYDFVVSSSFAVCRKIDGVKTITDLGDNRRKDRKATSIVRCPSVSMHDCITLAAKRRRLFPPSYKPLIYNFERYGYDEAEIDRYIDFMIGRLQHLFDAVSTGVIDRREFNVGHALGNSDRLVDLIRPPAPWEIPTKT